MIRDFLLGFQPVLAALEALHQQPTPAQPVVPQRAPLTPREEEERYVLDLDETRDLPAPAIPVLQYREPRYIPEWERPVEVVVEVDLAAEGEKPAWPFPDPVEQQDAPTEWQDGPPPSIGWFNCQDDQDRRCRFTELARHWDGTRWSAYTGVTDVFTDGAARVATTPSFEDCFSGIGVNICWRGPCLAGADLPELAAALHDVPSAQDCRTAYLVAPQDDKRSDLALLREFVPHAGPIGDLTAAENVPPHRRAEFIRRCNELR